MRRESESSEPDRESDGAEWEQLDRYLVHGDEQGNVAHTIPDAAALRARLLRTRGAGDAEVGHRLWGRMQHHIQQDGTTPQTSVVRRLTVLERSTRRRSSPSLGWGIAAVAAVVGVIGIGGVMVSRAGNGPSVTYRTGAGERQRIALRDGSIMTLAPRTVAQVNGSAITLTGEALFSIEHRSATPYVVHTGAVTTRVLGTVFDVRHYDDDADVHVSVIEGKVGVGARSIIPIVAGRTARVTDSSATIMITDDRALPIEWTSGRLVFRDTPLSDALVTLGHWYGYTFRLADSSLATTRLNATFTQHSIDGVMSALSSVLHVVMTVDRTSDVPVITVRAERTSRSHQAEIFRDSLTTHSQEVGR